MAKRASPLRRQRAPTNPKAINASSDGVAQASPASLVDGALARETTSSRDRILDAAESVVSERSYAAASISLISKKAGLPASSIYWHFHSKEDLLGAVVERGVQRWFEAHPKWHPYKGDFDGFLQAIGKAAGSQPTFLRILMMMILDRSEGLPRARQTMKNVWLEVQVRVQHIVAEHFRLGSDKAGQRIAERLARFTMALADGAFLDSQIDPRGTSMINLFSDLGLALQALAAAMNRSANGRGPLTANWEKTRHRDWTRDN
jgi:AcrR family transcriptional regulator